MSEATTRFRPKIVNYYRFPGGCIEFMIVLCLFIVAVSIRQVFGISNFTEDNLFMLSSDIKVIRLKDFFRCGITSVFNFEAIDALDPSKIDNTTKLPLNMRIHRSKYMKYELQTIDKDANTKLDLSDTEDVLYVGDDYFILRNKKEFGIFTVGYNQSTNQNMGEKYVHSFKIEGQSPHDHFISDGNYFMIYVDNNNKKTGTLQYYIVDPNNSTNMTQFRVSSSFNLRNTLSSYKFSKDFSRNKEYRLLGWMSSFAILDDVFFECNSTFTTEWIIKCRNLSIILPAEKQQNYTMITASIHDASSIKIVVKENSKNNNFSYSICSYEHIQGVEQKVGLNCKLFHEIPIDLLSNTKSRPIDFGEGFFGIWTEQFLLHASDLNYQKMEKTYMQIPHAAFITDLTNYEIAFATKNSKFISIAVFNSSQGRDKRIIDYFAVIELGLSPPEILNETSAQATYFRLQDSKLFRNQRSPNNSIKQLGYGFQDAFIEVQGNCVESKLNKNSSATSEILQFRIIGVGGDGVSNFKDFNLTLIREALGVAKLEIPFDKVSLIRGGKISLTLFEEYAVGNDLNLKIEAMNQAVDVTTIKERIFEVQLDQKLNDHKNSIYKVILLWDNMALFASNLSNKDSIYVCYLTIKQSVVEKKDIAYCDLIFSTVIKPGRFLKEAILLNFKHLLVVFEKNEPNNMPKDKYNIHYAVVYSIEKNSTSDSSNYLSADVEFNCTRTNQSFITYTYPGSAVIIYLIDDYRTSATTTQDFIKMIKFQQLPNNSFVHSLIDVEYDTTRITSIFEISPDYSTKNYFYIGVAELGLKRKTHYSYISETKKNGVDVGLLQTAKKIDVSISFNDSGRIGYCGARDELIILNFNQLVNNTADKLATKPFRTKYPIQERMLRRLPLTTLGFETIIAYDCMDERNNLMIIATNRSDLSKKNKSGDFAIVNYEMSYVSDPRKRVETIIDLPADFNSKEVLINAKSFSSVNKDFVIVSYLADGNASNRKFLYAEMPVKVMKFELMCPQHVSNKFEFNVSINNLHSKRASDQSKILQVDVRPLEYQTQILINNDAKLSKATRTYILEENLLTIKGHFFSARLHQPGKDPSQLQNEIVLINKLSVKETMKIDNIVQARLVEDLIVLRSSCGNLEVYYDKSNRNKSTIYEMQSNYMEADIVPPEALPSNSSREQAYIVFAEEKKSAMLITYMQMNLKINTSNSSDAGITKLFKISIDGTFKSFTSVYCGKNYYVKLMSKPQRYILLGSLNVSSNSTQGTFKANATLELSSEVVASDILCLNDTKDEDDSVAMLILYKNQSQYLYKFRENPSRTELQFIELNFMKDKAYFVNDFDCDNYETVKSGENFLTKFKCFYSTRWADDYVVYYGIESGPNFFKLQETKIIKSVEEVKDIDIIKTITNGKYALVIGELLTEPLYQRNYYAMVYDFNIADTKIISAIRLDRNVDIDADRFKEMIAIGTDGTIGVLYKNTQKSMIQFDNFTRFEFKPLTLEVKQMGFDLTKLNLEILNLGGEVMEKISMMNLFNLDAEKAKYQAHPFAQVMIYTVLLIAVLTLVSAIFLLINQSIYSRSKVIAKKYVRGFQLESTAINKMTDRDQAFNDDDSDEFLEAVMKETNLNRGNDPHSAITNLLQPTQNGNETL